MNPSTNIKAPQIETYMLNKMEEKLSRLQKSRHAIMNINSIEDFHYNKNKIVQNFFDIEDDLRESFQLVKSTLTQNKELVEQIEFEENVGRNLERKIESQDKEIEMMKRDLIRITKQLQMMEDRQRGDEDYIKDLERKLMAAEVGPMRKEEVKENNFTNEGMNVSLNISPNNTSLNNMSTNKKNNDESADQSFSTANLNYKYNNNKQNNEANVNTVAGIAPSNINNYSELLNERENSKKMINEFVNEHMSIKKVDKTPNTNTNLNANVNENVNVNANVNAADKNNNISEKQETNLKSSNQNAKTTKLKGNRVADILVKLNSNPDIDSILNKLFGEDILNKLMSPSVDEKFLERVEATILEIEKLKEKDADEEEEIPAEHPHNEYMKYPLPQNNNKQHYNEQNNAPAIEEKPEENYQNYQNPQEYQGNKYPLFYQNDLDDPYKNKYDILKENNLSNSRINKSNSNFYSRQQMFTNRTTRGKNVYEENNFENSLRKYVRGYDKKVFKNYTKPYGDFFDPTLQKGGQTKYNFDNNKQGRSKSKSSRLYDNSYSNPSNSLIQYKFYD